MNITHLLLWCHYRDCNAYPRHQLWLTSSVSKCLSLTKTCYKSKRWIPYKWGSAVAASDYVWSSWDWTSCSGLKGKQEGTVTYLEKRWKWFFCPPPAVASSVNVTCFLCVLTLIGCLLLLLCIVGPWPVFVHLVTESTQYWPCRLTP